MPWSITAAACRVDTPSGIATRRLSETSAFSAYAPSAFTVATRSPGFRPVTPGPTLSTTPATSPPGVNGYPAGL